MSLAQRLQKARLTLLLDFPFYGALAMRMTMELDEGVGSASTDGRTIRFCPSFCEKLSDKQLVWLFAHEVSHPALGHPWRIGSRNLDKFNSATDFVVNEMLEQVMDKQPGARNRMERIPRVLLDSQYFGMSAEEIYSILPDEPAGGGSGGRTAVGTFSKPKPPAPQQENRPDPLQQEWQQAAQQAAIAARMKSRGSLPGMIEELLRELVEPVVPWQDLLRQFASRVSRSDYSWSRPNRRYLGQGVILPSLSQVTLGPLVVAVDTSGSIRCNEKLLTAFLSELQGILDQTGPERVDLLDCDAYIRGRHEFRPGDDLRGTKFRGGGGTRFEPVFEDVSERDLAPAALIYFTDLEGSFPEHAPEYPVLWLNYGNPRRKAPFGETITVLPS